MDLLFITTTGIYQSFTDLIKGQTFNFLFSHLREGQKDAKAASGGLGSLARSVWPQAAPQISL